MKLLLHTCCAPCSTYVVDKLRKDGFDDITAYWYNINIHPFTEYKARLDTLKMYAEKINMPLVINHNYGIREFTKAVIEDIDGRCKFCYESRLEKTAKYAKENGYDAFTTTLLVSPYQKHELIIAVAKRMAEKYGVEFVYQDFREGFRIGQQMARDAGLYMQKYCGCIYSEYENALERENRKKKKEKIEMIIFDLDGTLWETTDTTYESANEIMKKHNIDYEITKEVIVNTMGCNFQEAAKNYMPNLDEEYRINLLKEINTLNSQVLYKKGGNIYPNLENVLIELKKKYRLAIVSNCADNYIESFLESSGLESYFEDFIAASKMRVLKSEAIKKIMERNGIGNAIYVGDTLKDYEASQKAGIEFIHARYGFERILESKYSINDITELPRILEEFAK